MRYSKGHREKTHSHIIETASRNFRAHGLDDGIASIMQTAGLTNGAFSNHFTSKNELIGEAITHALQERVDNLNLYIDAGRGLEGIIRGYLSVRHRDEMASGCATSSLAAEIARYPPTVRKAFTDGMANIVDILAAQWPEIPGGKARSKAMVLYGLMAGVLQLSRAVNDDALSRQVLEEGQAAALAFAEADTGT
jgi:TetR/AcrR family transcriptional repressor of nem operon